MTAKTKLFQVLYMYSEAGFAKVLYNHVSVHLILNVSATFMKL